jgi:hypothetical protein
MKGFDLDEPGVGSVEPTTKTSDHALVQSAQVLK